MGKEVVLTTAHMFNPICVGTLLVFHNDKLTQVQSGWWLRSCLGEVVFQGGGPADRTPV